MNKFAQEIAKIPSDKKSFKVYDKPGHDSLHICYFGVPSYEEFDRYKLEFIPSTVNYFCFYLGGEQEKLIQAFIESDYAEKIEYLAIGNSSYSYGNSMNYSQLVSLLSQADFPKLKSLSLGVWALFSNSHCSYGYLGDVTMLLEKLTHIEKLGLYGNFELSSTLNFNNLKDLTVLVADFMAGTCRTPISNLTLSNLLNSQFPLLEEADIDLEHYEDTEIDDYTFTDNFLNLCSTPCLRKLEISGHFFS